jgi:3-methyladenine DNA glycosylase AlkD
MTSKRPARTVKPAKRGGKTTAKALPASTSAAAPERPLKQQVADVLGWLKRSGTKASRDGMARYGIPSDKAFGVPVGVMQQHATRLGRSHELAAALWETGWYEARMMASFLDDPDRVTPSQMDKWCRDFDSWAICDTVCFKLFDRSPHAFAKVEQWSRRREEFIRRGAFALLACLALHDKAADTESFARLLPLVERGATDERNFVKKGVSWALRGIGRRNPELHSASVALARRLAAPPEAAPRWVGKDALRDLNSTAVTRRMQARR